MVRRELRIGTLLLRLENQDSFVDINVRQVGDVEVVRVRNVLHVPVVFSAAALVDFKFAHHLWDYLLGLWSCLDFEIEQPLLLRLLMNVHRLVKLAV